MKYALVGYGRMGRAIEASASARGHVCAAVVDRSSRLKRAVGSIDRLRWTGIPVAFEFTEPAAAKDHVIALLTRGVSVVCGTTGWDASDPDVRRALKSSRAGAVIAPNFSVGMNLFYRAVADAARSYEAAGGYDPWIAEWHHRAKVDAPSGTALHLARLVGGEVPVAAVRAGHEPGRHVVGFDGPYDTVTLTHAARGRDGFAAGAVLAAEWVAGRRGAHGFDDVLADLVAGGTKKRGGKR